MKRQLSCFLESNVSDNDERTGEIALFAFFSLRTMSNLGVNQTSDNLGVLLADAGKLVPAFANGSSTGGFQLIPYPGYEGRKRFLPALRMTDAKTWFDVKHKGFGLLGRGLGYYAPVAVLGLVRFLAQKRWGDALFLEKLATTAAMCGQMQLNHQIGITNQLQLGCAVISRTCNAFLTDESDAGESPKRLSPEDFIGSLGRLWPGFPAELFADLPPQECITLRQLEQDHLKNVLADVLNLCKNCRDKAAFANAYRQMRHDARYIAEEWPGNQEYRTTRQNAKSTLPPGRSLKPDAQANDH